MDNCCCVYMHTNLINNKKYIGQTKQIPEKRWGKNGERYKTCPHFYKAIQKYGWDGFRHEIIRDHLSQEESYKLEVELIKQYKTTDKEYGYNIHSGGLYGGYCEKKNLIGLRFGEWKVLDDDIQNTRNCICECVCGTVRSVARCNLISGKSTNCGCVQHKHVSEMSSTHGMTNTKLYSVWGAYEKQMQYIH